jgi:hypothetical protein
MFSDHLQFYSDRLSSLPKYTLPILRTAGPISQITDKEKVFEKILPRYFSLVPRGILIEEIILSGIHVTIILAIEHSTGPKLPEYHKLLVGCFQGELTLVHSVEDALNFINSHRVDVLLINSPLYEVLTLAKNLYPEVATILFGNCTIEDYSTDLKGDHIKLLDHFIFWREDSSFCQLELLTTLQKIIRKDIFGIEKYLDGGATLASFPVMGTMSREQLVQEIEDFCKSCSLNSNTTRKAKAITEELIMNAIYDAPIAGGENRYEDKRNLPFELEPKDRSILTIGCDSEVLLIGIKDPFGAFKREKFFEYANKIIYRYDNERLIDTKVGGAGLGIFKMLYDSNGLILNTSPTQATEVIAIIEMTLKNQAFTKMGRSLHYFSQTPKID